MSDRKIYSKDFIKSEDEANKAVFKIAATDIAKMGLIVSGTPEETAKVIYDGLLTALETDEPFWVGEDRDGDSHGMRMGAVALFPDVGEFIRGTPQVTLVWFGDHLDQPTQHNIDFIQSMKEANTH